MSDELQPERRRRVVERPVTLESHGERMTPTAVCPRKLKLVSLESCGTCEAFAGLCINPEGRAPFLRCSFEESSAEARRGSVADVMTAAPLAMTEAAAREHLRVSAPGSPVAIVVGPEEPVAYVAAVMAYERAHHAIVMDAEGDVVGLIDALDVVRWFACREGYIVPGS